MVPAQFMASRLYSNHLRMVNGGRNNQQREGWKDMNKRQEG